MIVVNRPYLTVHSKRICICAAPERGAHTMTVVNRPYLTLQSERMCICAATGRGAHRNDSGKQTLPDTTF
eukprot:10976284-Karenia_brevis.AAC.1